MLVIPEMVMVGGNSRNSGKTTLACSIISKLAATQEVIGLKVTSIRPGEENLHGNHVEELTGDFSIWEELNAGSHKDTSKMLRAGATHVYYIRVAENHKERAILYFMSNYIKKQIIVCESRSLHNIINPGLFLLMMRLPATNKSKDVSEYLSMADKVFNFSEDLIEIEKFTDNLRFKDKKFVWD